MRLNLRIESGGVFIKKTLERYGSISKKCCFAKRNFRLLTEQIET